MTYWHLSVIYITNFRFTVMPVSLFIISTFLDIFRVLMFLCFVPKELHGFRLILVFDISFLIS